ncbi:hypothetical protein [Albidovulum sp.]|uniref:hypothetical protein n=1 Tax=Albidovulum sp. TaxID=1872424 RepID=UPI001D1DF234|nr:hypothetical protein [Paracoccaceae bacterium]HPE26923.1 hypothetical protein [Albidovulum sp.]MCB2119892.1 hypothetical protein [Paracoccaceae bacterium]MCB2139188.1 hypothetical protein [Paracoccaceae bacterium]MCB2142887.1 hypothetical protein [Paracoccaceae bacterium]
MSDLPEYYFRVRESGAAVFRVDAENRQRRIEMDQIATVNVKNGEIRPNGGRNLSADDLAAIRGWLADRRVLLAERETDDLWRTVDQLNQVAHWAQSRATDQQLEAASDALLMAMHDLRSVLIRRKSERPAASATD